MRNFKTMGLSLPAATVQKIDKDRGKISRSLYVREIIEIGLAAAAAGAANQNK
jgi:hypothetical protein